MRLRKPYRVALDIIIGLGIAWAFYYCLLMAIVQTSERLGR